MGVKVTYKDGRIERTTGDAVERSRLQVDAYKWYASKLAPRKYSEKYVQEHTGADGGPIKTESIQADIQARLDAIRERMRALALPETKSE